MSHYDIVQAVKDGKGKHEFATVESGHNGNRLRIYVFREAMKFDDVPAMTWKMEPIPGDTRVFQGVRLPASAQELQQIADLLGCMLLTPKVVDMLWLQSGLHFNPVVNSGPPSYGIVATMNIHDVHTLIEKKISDLGGDDGSKLVECVGKYWVLCNALATNAIVQGAPQAFNYGWCDSGAPKPGFTQGVKVWQNLAGAHNYLHWDPSQTIRLMYRWAKLLRVGAERWENIVMSDVLQDPELAPLASHEGVLKTMRQSGVPAPEESGQVFLPVVEIVKPEPLV